MPHGSRARRLPPWYGHKAACPVWSHAHSRYGHEQENHTS